MSNEHDNFAARQAAAYDRAARAVRMIQSGSTGQPLYVSQDGAISNHLAREVVFSSIFAVNPGASLTVPAFTGQQAVLVAHTTNPAGPFNISTQTNQFFNGMVLETDTEMVFETNQAVYIGNSSAPIKFGYYVVLGGRPT